MKSAQLHDSFFLSSCARFMNTGVEKAYGWVHVRLGVNNQKLSFNIAMCPNQVLAAVSVNRS